ncbi:SIS domain-containing protein [Dinoroseobacter sp. S124A]|uniref:SIS domain-containing protein n=1 Tax=Dinoroseobacter sp. S124A TaxID=3415128 RepID=UPI003C7C0A8F
MTSPDTQSWMAREIAEIPEAAARLTGADAQASLQALAGTLRAAEPTSISLIAHGSSRHAGAVIGHALWRCLGLPVALEPLAPGGLPEAVASGRPRAVLGISQSGQSPDLSAAMAAARGMGALTLAVTNTPGSPLAEAAAHGLDMAAGPEQAVAATKSFVNSALAGLWLVAHWADDAALADALTRAPEALRMGTGVDPALEAVLCDSAGLFVLGRAAAAGVAAEIALKAMELCGRHATAYSEAEVLHGPAAIAVEGFGVIGLVQPEGGAVLDRLAQQGARCYRVPEAPLLHPLVDPLIQLPPVYRALEAATRRLGRNPDRPQFLAKVTRTH